MRIRLVLVVIVGLVSTLGASKVLAADCYRPTMTAFGKEIPKLTLRKTADGTREESKPAQVAYERPNVGKDYVLLDAALRWEAVECTAGETGRVILMPLVEIHRSKLETNEVKKSTAKLEAELTWGRLRGDEPGSSQGSLWRPLVKLEYAESRDAVKNQNFTVSGISVNTVSNLPGQPGGWLYWRCDSISNSPSERAPACPEKFRWLPSVGAEYYDSLPVERRGLPTIPEITTTVGVARVALEWWPLLQGRGTSAPRARLQLTADYAHRWRVDGDRLPDGNGGLFTVGLTWYLDASQSIGIGVDHENGRGPTRNFEDEKRTVIAIRIKF